MSPTSGLRSWFRSLRAWIIGKLGHPELVRLDGQQTIFELDSGTNPNLENITVKKDASATSVFKGKSEQREEGSTSVADTDESTQTLAPSGEALNVNPGASEASDRRPLAPPQATEDDRVSVSQLELRLNALLDNRPGAPIGLTLLPTYGRIQNVVGEKVRILQRDHARIVRLLDDWSDYTAAALRRLVDEASALESERDGLFTDEDVFVALLDDLELCDADVVEELRPHFAAEARRIGFSSLIWPQPGDAVDSGRHEVAAVEGPVLVTPLVVARVVGVGYIAANGTTIRARVLARHRT